MVEEKQNENNTITITKKGILFFLFLVVFCFFGMWHLFHLLDFESFPPIGSKNHVYIIPPKWFVLPVVGVTVLLFAVLTVIYDKMTGQGEWAESDENDETQPPDGVSPGDKQESPN